MNPYYALALVVSAFISSLDVMTAWGRRRSPGAIGLLILMLGMTIWSGTYAVRWMETHVESQIAWLDSTYLGVVMVPYGLVVMVLQLTKLERLLTKRNLLLLAIEPFLTLVFIWTDSYHGLFFGGKHTLGSILSGGPWFYFHLTYTYLIFIGIMAFFSREYWQSSQYYRIQAGSIVLGLAIPWLANIISLAGFFPFKDLDITPFAFIVSGIIFTFSMFRFGLLDMVPMAYNQLMSSIPDGVIVLDVLNRLVDINKSASQITGISIDGIGRPAGVVFAKFPGLVDLNKTHTEEQFDLRIPQAPDKVFNLHSIPLFSRRGQPGGLLIMVHDITNRVQLMEQLRTQSITDTLTGLYNRSFFESEMARLNRRRLFHVSIFVVDVDLLKQVNDQHGHEAGDVLLKRTAQVLTTSFRAEDIIARIGGDEFVAILPNTDESSADIALQRLKGVLKEHNDRFDGLPLRFSVGSCTATSPMSMEETFKLADAAMYKEKRERQNLVIPG